MGWRLFSDEAHSIQIPKLYISFLSQRACRSLPWFFMTQNIGIFNTLKQSFCPRGQSLGLEATRSQFLKALSLALASRLKVLTLRPWPRHSRSWFWLWGTTFFRMRQWRNLGWGNGGWDNGGRVNEAKEDEVMRQWRMRQWGNEGWGNETI